MSNFVVLATVLAHRDDIQTAFEFHLADESSDDTPAA